MVTSVSLLLRLPRRLLIAAGVAAAVALGMAARAADTSSPAKTAPASRQESRPTAIHIEADALRYDDQKQISVFTGNVTLTRGNMVVEGERVELRQDALGYQSGTITPAPGQRAHLTQFREGENETVIGDGSLIEYDGRTDVFRLIGAARLRRLHGSEEADVMTGQIIVYDNLKDVFTVDGATPASQDSAQPAGARVRATLTPRSATATTAPRSTPSAPAKAPQSGDTSAKALPPSSTTDAKALPLRNDDRLTPPVPSSPFGH